MSERRFYIQAHQEEGMFHGGIGIVDMERILGASGFEPINFPYQYNFSIKAKIARFVHFLKMLFTIPSNSTVVFSFPLYARIHKLLVHGLIRKKSRVICYIADINGLKDGDPLLLEKEVKELKRHKNFIVHNQGMQRWLNKHVALHHSGEIEFFDFLTKPVSPSRKKEKTIAFAGNLEKSSFLEKLELLSDRNISFNLYGPGITQNMINQRGVFFKGIFPPYDLPSQIEGSFGLVWDGDSIDGPGGSLGHYMQYISHHKLSLYILSGLPLIVPSFAGSASLIEKYKIGFTISTLHELNEKIEDLAEDKYQEMIRNMKPLAEKISRGQCLVDALDELMPVDRKSIRSGRPKNILNVS